MECYCGKELGRLDAIKLRDWVEQLQDSDLFFLYGMVAGIVDMRSKGA